MSIDLLILKFVEDVEDLGEAACETTPLGERDHVMARVRHVFQNAQDAGGGDLMVIEREEFALEFSTGPEEPAESLHVTLRLGRDWSEASLDVVVGRLAEVCETGWSVYELSGNERLHPPLVRSTDA